MIEDCGPHYLSVRRWAERFRQSDRVSIGLPDALRIFVEDEIFSKCCGDACQMSKGKKCAHAAITDHLFSYLTWNKAEDKLPEEMAKSRGVKYGGQFLYLLRKCRELPDSYVGLGSCARLRDLPVYGALPLPGELMDPLDKFVLS